MLKGPSCGRRSKTADAQKWQDKWYMYKEERWGAARNSMIINKKKTSSPNTWAPISLTPSLHLALFTPFIINLYYYFNSLLMWAFESCKIFPISHPLDHDGHETSDGLEDSKKQDHGQEPPRSAVYWIGSSRSTWPWMVANEWRRLLNKQFQMSFGIFPCFPHCPRLDGMAGKQRMLGVDAMPHVHDHSIC